MTTETRIDSRQIIATIIACEASEACGIDPRQATIVDCCAIADHLTRDKANNPQGRTIDPRKVAALLAGVR